MTYTKALEDYKKKVDIYKDIVDLAREKRLNNNSVGSTARLECYLRTLPIDTILDIVALEYFAISKEVNDGQTVEEAFEEERKCFEYPGWKNKKQTIDQISEKSNLDKHLIESLNMLKLI